MKAARLTFASVGALVVLLAAAHALEPSSALQAVIDGAKKEGKLEIVAPGSVIGNSQQVQEIGKAMNATFGTDIAVSYVPGPPSVPQMLDNIETSQKAGLPSPTSVFIAPTELAGLAQRHNAVGKVDWAALLPGRITAKIIEADGTALRAYTTLPGGIIYNTQLAPSKPKLLTDLLAPEWKGKIASTPYAASFDIISSTDRWGEEKALAFARKMAKQVGGLIGCPDIERIASGEFVAFAMDCSGRTWVQYKRDGAPIDFVVPADEAVRRFYYWSVPKNAPQPNAAKLFIVFMETPEGQKLLWKDQDDDLDDFADSGMAKVVSDYEKQGLKFQTLDIAWFDKHPEVAKARAVMPKILATGG